MPRRIRTLLKKLAPLITAVALAPVCIHFASAALQAGMVTLLISDLVSPNLFRFYVPAYVALLYLALYMALTCNSGKPDYWKCAAIVLPIPAIDCLHDLITNSLNGLSLRAYLVFITGYTLLASLVMLAVHWRRARAWNAAKPSLCSSTQSSKSLLQPTI